MALGRVSQKTPQSPGNRKKVKDLLQNSIIEPSVSLQASPVVLVKKADKTSHLCIDYRNFNKTAIKDPLPHIQDTLDMLCGNSLFTTFDLLKKISPD